ncbi:MAG: hypothetical protein WC620_06000 [Methanoregula sp.]
MVTIPPIMNAGDVALLGVGVGTGVISIAIGVVCPEATVAVP